MNDLISRQAEIGCFERFGMDESIDWYAQNEVEVWMPLPEPYRGGTK